MTTPDRIWKRWRGSLPRPRKLLVGSGLILAALIAAAAVWLISDLGRKAIVTTDRSLGGLAAVLADQASRSLQAIELVQDSVLEELQSAHVGDEAGFIARMSGETVYETLRSRIAGLPQVNAVTVIDQDGNLLNFSRYWPIPRINISDRDYFRALIAHPAMKRFISKPVANRGDGKVTIYIARKVSGPDGKFLGLILGAVELTYFENLYRTLVPGPDYAIAVFRDDGMLLIRYPLPVGGVGQKFRTLAVRRAVATSAPTTLRVLSPIDRQDRLVAAQPLSRYPMHLTVSRTVSASLKTWRQQALALTIAAVLLELGLLGLVVLGDQQVHAQERLSTAEAARASAEERERSERVLRQQYSRFGTALENMVQGLCMFDDNDALIVMNERFAAMHAVPPALRQPGTNLAAILRHVLGPEACAENVPWTHPSATGANEPYALPLADGRWVKVTHAPIPEGGWVCTHEDITERKQHEARLSFLAHHDLLTGLPNRVALRGYIEQAIARPPPEDRLAVLCLDLDGFKGVNDTLGHPAGDALLCQVAGRLKDNIRQTDFLARLGGDEFAIVQSGGEQPGSAEQLAARLVSALRQAFHVEGKEVEIGTSIGVMLADVPGLQPNELLRRADIALYRAKAAGRDTWRLFDLDMDAAVQRRRELEADLKHAITAEQFQLYYQPVVAAAARNLIGFEALLRWRHPVHGLMAPSLFIPMAEEMGLIRPLGSWVLARACADAARWPDYVKIAINISPIQLTRANLVREVELSLAASGLDPCRLELEVTESVLLQDNEATLDQLHELRAMGVRIVMDDFGTGYASLSYLRRFPFDKIKVDQSFIRSLEREKGSVEIVRAVLGLGKALGVSVLAEGVESQQQFTILNEEGFDELQGYLFSRPVPLSQVQEIIRTYPSFGKPGSFGKTGHEPDDHRKMVGAAGFEPTTPSPPD